MASRMRGAAELIDLSMLEAQILGLTYYPVTYYEMLGRPWRDARRLTVPGIARAKDGLIDIGCGTAQQWFDLCAMTGHQDWIDEESPLSITGQANEKSAELYAWVESQTVDEIRDLATAFRIPNAPVANGANVESLDHFLARGSFLTNPRDGFSQPGPPYRMQPALLRAPQPAPRLGEHSEQYRRNGIPGRQGGGLAAGNSISPFEGLRVVDMTTFWAGPSCTHMLAMLGAEVIHVESTRRPDGTRLIAGIPITEDQWWEKSPIFSGLNTNKKGLTLDLQSAAGRELLMRLIATCDVIVENFTPRVLDQIGLDFAAVQAVRPDAIMLRMPGFGLDGPWRDNPAFAYVIEAASGISWLTGYPDRNPYEPYSVGDPNAGVHALNALLLALEQRRRTGQGMHIEAAMVDAALNIAAEQIIEYSAYGALLQRAGNRGPTAAPQNLYRTNEIDEFGRRDCWVAVAVVTDEQWAGLCDALGRPGWATDPALATAEDRHRHHDRIDEHLNAWCERRSGEEIVEALWSHGVPVAKVMQPHRQSELPQLAVRGFFEDVDHAVNARTPHSTLPFTSTRGPDRVHLQPAPLLGQHNHELLSELGLQRQGHRRTGGARRDRHRTGHARHEGLIASPLMAIEPSDILLTGRVAVVTGGGEGIGRGIAEGMAAFGASVAIWEHNVETCTSAAEAIGGLGIVTDVRDSEQVDAALHALQPNWASRRSWSTMPAACSPRRCSTPAKTAGMRCTNPTFAMCCCAHNGWPAAWWTTGSQAASST